jgi:L-aspartate oxidase
MQFHPTALALAGAPRFLISEAVRGEGAYLVNERGERFMLGADERAELAPRDVVARAIVAEANKGTKVFLDLRHIPADHIRMRFPRIAEVCASFGLDITRDLVPVLPAAHYLMGGVKTDLDGRTHLARLFAAGETACTGVHGANRLASNSLLEGLVYGARAGAAMAAHGPHKTSSHVSARSFSGDIAKLRNKMWVDAGVVRDNAKLKDALAYLRKTLSPGMPSRLDRARLEALNIAQCAELIVCAALAREESRGAHYRTDFPQHNDERFRAHSLMRNGELRFEQLTQARSHLR